MDGKDPRPPKTEDSYSDRIEINAFAEIVKTALFGLVTLIVLFTAGNLTAIAIAIALYLLNFRYFHVLNNRIFSAARLAKEDDQKDDSYLPEDFHKLDWKAIAQVPGVDAERLKETFEYLYKRVAEGTLQIASDGEWHDALPKQASLS